MSSKYSFLFGLTVCLSFICWAFPPAPPATISGKVRGEFGFGLEDGETALLLLADDEVVSRSVVSAAGLFGENYRLILPLDLNPSDGVYRSEALTPEDVVIYSFVAERNGVRIPVSRVELSTEPLKPEAGATTRIDFTLGDDVDADGLPDSWERFQASLMSGFEGDPLALFDEEGDQDGDGLSDRDEYIAGTFALLFEDGLNFQLLDVSPEGSAELSFLAVDGKVYRIEGSTDLKTWFPVSFSLPENPAAIATQFLSQNTDSQTVFTEPVMIGTKVIYRLRVD